MIELSDDMIFAEGGRRYCFIHPQDASKCIKILSPNGDPVKRKQEAVWYKKMRPLSMFDDNKRELKSFQDLAKKGEVVWNYFPRCYGIHLTNRGRGIVTDLIRNTDGSLPLTVHQYLKERGQTPELLTALDDFFSFLRNKAVITRDILDHNIIVHEGAEKLSIMMIDGFGSSEIIPFSSWMKPIGERKINRKIHRFRTRYGC